MSDVGTSPLQQTAARLTALDEHLAYRVGVPEEHDWHWLRDLDTELLADWHAQLTTREGDRRAAAAYLGGWVAAAVVEAYLLPMLAEARLPLVGIDGVAVHRHADGWFDAVALPDGPVGVLREDSAAGGPGVEVRADRDALLDATAERLAGVGPLFDAVSAVMPVGLPALWGGLADSVGGRSLWLARLLDRDRGGAWADAQALTDRVAAGQPRLRQRPTPFPVTFRGGDEWFQVRSTCCLYYRTVESPDPDGDGYCGTCPLRTDASRTRRLRVHLEEQTPR